MSGPCSCQTRCVFTAHGTKPCAMKVASTVFNGGDEETGCWHCALSLPNGNVAISTFETLPENY